MKEQKFIIENQESFELEDIFECGQCFRWNKQEDGSYIGIVKDAVINVQKKEDRIVFSGVSQKSDFKELIRNYFDLDTNYDDLKKKLSQMDKHLEIATKFGKRN